jgi:nucleoid DNA-binding protein
MRQRYKTKKELVEKIAKIAKVKDKQVAAIVTLFLESITSGLEHGDIVQIDGFGELYLKEGSVVINKTNDNKDMLGKTVKYERVFMRPMGRLKDILDGRKVVC